jgi:membrane fusion protein
MAQDAPPRAGQTLELFRPEVLAEQQTQWLGTVLLAPRLSHRVFVLLGALAAGAILALLFFASYTRTARVSGWLVPKDGLARVVAPQAGVVSALHVSEGARVRTGERLLTLSGELRSAAVGATQAEIMRRLAQRLKSLAADRDYELGQLPREQRELVLRVQGLKEQLAQIAGEIELQQSRVAIAERAEALHRELQKAGYIGEPRFQQVVAETLEQRARLSALERNRLALVRQHQEAEHALRDLPGNVKKEVARLEREIAQLEQQRAEVEARREMLVTAPYDGTVSALLVLPGAHTSAGTPLLSVVPASAALEAHLFSPSRALGFVRPGQKVRLRYEAYPYQKFGHYEGEVSAVSRSPVSAGELPPQAGSTGEPLYRISVSLARQSASAYGQELALQPGMLLEGDVALDRRRLYEWVLDPLYTLSGKWQ